MPSHCTGSHVGKTGTPTTHAGGSAPPFNYVPHVKWEVKYLSLPRSFLYYRHTVDFFEIHSRPRTTETFACSRAFLPQEKMEKENRSAYAKRSISHIKRGPVIGCRCKHRQNRSPRRISSDPPDSLSHPQKRRTIQRASKSRSAWMQPLSRLCKPERLLKPTRGTANANSMSSPQKYRTRLQDSLHAPGSQSRG